MANKADIQKPTGNDYISLGDNAITANAEVLEQLWDDHRRLDSRAYKIIPFQEFPGTDITQWYGFENEGVYRVPSTSVQETLTGYPQGAGPGTLSVVAIGSAASRVEWVEMGDMGRTWVGTISSSSAYRDDWHLVQTTKRHGTSLTVGRANDVRTPGDVGHALPLTLGARVHRWRLHFRNTNDRTTNTIAGALTLTGVHIGEMQRDTAGAASGEIIAGTLHQVIGSTLTPTNGGEYVTPWVSDYPLEPSTDYVIRYGITAAEGQQINYLEGGGWALDAGSTATTAADPAMTLSARSPLDVWIEVEVDASVPCFAYFGDSLTAGQGATLPVYDSWPARHARARGAIPTFYAHAGARMSEWTNPAHIKFRKYQLPGYNIARPDVLYWSMGSNDLFAEDKSVEDMLAAMAVTFPLITDMTTRNVVMTTVLPRHDPSDPQETARREWNEYIKRNLPWGTLMVLDAADALTAPSGDQLADSWSATPADIHLSSAGYARFAAQVH